MLLIAAAYGMSAYGASACSASACNPTLCLLGLVQLVGLATAGVARFVEGTRHEAWGQWLCFGGLALIGTVSGAAIRIGPDAAAACAVTLALMTMIAIIDIRPRG
jgi:hypothetical protein